MQHYVIKIRLEDPNKLRQLGQWHTDPKQNHNGTHDHINDTAYLTC